MDKATVHFDKPECQVVALYAPTARSGKTTVAEVFQTYGYRKLSFAAPVKGLIDLLLGHLGYDPETRYAMMYGDSRAVEIPELNTTPRHLLQTMATEWGRQTIDPGIWLKIWQHKLNLAVEKGITKIVVDDMRFPNEKYVLEHLYGAKAIMVRRPGAPILDHASEGNLSEHKFWAIINNDGTLPQLQAAAIDLIKQLE